MVSQQASGVQESQGIGSDQGYAGLGHSLHHALSFDPLRGDFFIKIKGVANAEISKIVDDYIYIEPLRFGFNQPVSEGGASGVPLESHELSEHSGLGLFEPFPQVLGELLVDEYLVV